MIKGWRYLGRVNGVYIYQQNKSYVGVVSYFKKPIPPIQPTKGFIYSPSSLIFDIDRIYNDKYIYSPSIIDFYLGEELSYKYINSPSDLVFEIDKLENYGKYINSPSIIDFYVESVPIGIFNPPKDDNYIYASSVYEVTCYGI